MGRIGRSSYEAQVLELIEGLEQATSKFMVAMLRVRRGAWTGCTALHNLVVRIVKDDPVCRRLMTVPGVGPITALTFRAAVDDPLRFARSRALAANFGLTPEVHQSGTIDRDGLITKRGDIDVRTSLHQAAASLLMRVQKWSALKAWGLRIAKMNAAAAVARKLAVILHRLWLEDRDFQSNANMRRSLRTTPERTLSPARAASTKRKEPVDKGDWRTPRDASMCEGGRDEQIALRRIGFLVDKASDWQHQDKEMESLVR